MEGNVKKVIIHHYVLRGSCPYGMPPHFYKKFWPIMNDDFIKSIQNCSTSGSLLRGWNTAFITLKPKTQKAQRVSMIRDPSALLAHAVE